MKHSLQHGHFAVWSVLVLVIGLAPLCPESAIAVDTPSWGGGGGNPFRDECPKGSYLVGLKGRAGAWVDRIAPICAPWLPAKLTFGAPTIGEYHGTSRGGIERERICWGFGINNRAIQSMKLDRLSSDNFIESIEAHCTSLAPPPATVKLFFGGPITEDSRSREFETLGVDRPDDFRMGCPPGELGVGIHGTAGKFLDAIGLICGPLPSRMAPPATNVNPLAMKPAAPATKVNPLATAPATAATKANPLVKGPTDDMFTIVTPGKGDRVQQGRLVVMALQPKVGMTPVTELQFKWVDAPKSQPPYINTFAVDTQKLLKGYPIDQQVTRGHAGRWEVRARASGKAVPGPWSFPVQFNLFLTQPTQSQKKASPVQQTAPLPSTSVTQPSPVPQTSPLPPSSVTQAPAASTTTQMGRSSSMVMPRGVKGDEGTTTGDQAPAEQKP